MELKELNAKVQSREDAEFIKTCEPTFATLRLRDSALSFFQEALYLRIKTFESELLGGPRRRERKGGETQS